MTPTPVVQLPVATAIAISEVSSWRRFRHEWLIGAYALLYFATLGMTTWFGGNWTGLTNVLFFPMGGAAIWAQSQLARDARLDSRTRTGWRYLARASAATWFSGILWTVWLASNVGAKSPAWSDALDSVYIPLAVIAFLSFPADPRFTLRDRRLRLDAALLAVGGIGLMWNFGLRSLFVEVQGPTSFLNVLLVVGEWAVVLAASIAYLRVASPITRRAVAIAFGAHVMFILSDYFWANRQDVYAPGHWVDALWFSTWVLRWLAARSATHAAPTTQQAIGTEAPYQSGIAPTAFVAGAYTLLVFAVLAGDSGGAVGIALVASTMTALLLVRQGVELSENRRLTQATMVQAARFRSLISQASDFVMLIDKHHVVAYVSPSVQRAGIASVGSSIAELIHPEDQDAVAPWLEECATASVAAAPRRFRLRGELGKWRDIEFRAQDLTDDRHVRGFVVNGRDVSDEVMLEERLRHAQKLAALHEMAGRIAHAFNNALASIQGHAELLAHELPMEGTVREDVDAIRAAAERGAGITRQLLGFSGRNVIQPVPLHAGNVTRELIPTLTRLVPANVALETDIASDVGNVLFDRAQFEQVLVNLVANAADAMPQGGKIRLAIRLVASAMHPRSGKDGSNVVIEVADSGHGISSTNERRIFEPFFTTKSPGRGTGLGLAMVQAIVSRAGGSIAVESAVGEGTTFSITVPTSTGMELTSPATPTEVVRGKAEGAILLVDDDAAVRRASRRILERAGYTVVEASGGAMAIELAKRADLHFDILVTDMMMPQVSGRDVIIAVRQLRPGMPIVCVTGFATAHDTTPLPPEVHSIVAKPFTAATLARAVADAISSVIVAA
ncbi:MAG: ATP-binding protein [Gemmatimonadaceae bacterium]